mgnify:CR=1 FL=1
MIELVSKLFDTLPRESGCNMKQRILSILVDNTAGVLSRVSGLFSRRGYNIDSLTVGVTADPMYSRMTGAGTEGEPSECHGDSRYFSGKSDRRFDRLHGFGVDGNKIKTGSIYQSAQRWQ